MTLNRGSQVRALVRPPSSLLKPHVSDARPNRAFLRGFSATHLSDFGLSRCSRNLATVLAPSRQSRQPSPSPAATVVPTPGPTPCRDLALFASGQCYPDV